MKQEHYKYINKGKSEKFNLKCNKVIFSVEEINLIEKLGFWFEALTNGVIEPITEKQERFIAVIKGEKKIFSPEEQAWFKYIKRLEIEKKKGNKLYQIPQLESDSFYNRDQAKQMKKTMYGVINKARR